MPNSWHVVSMYKRLYHSPPRSHTAFCSLKSLATGHIYHLITDVDAGAEALLFAHGHFTRGECKTPLFAHSHFTRGDSISWFQSQSLLLSSSLYSTPPRLQDDQFQGCKPEATSKLGPFLDTATLRRAQWGCQRPNVTTSGGAPYLASTQVGEEQVASLL